MKCDSKDYNYQIGCALDRDHDGKHAGPMGNGTLYWTYSVSPNTKKFDEETHYFWQWEQLSYNEPVDKATTGLYNKFKVERVDGKDKPGRKHQGCWYFVLDPKHDPHARHALKAYARSCAESFPLLSQDLLKMSEKF